MVYNFSYVSVVGLSFFLRLNIYFYLGIIVFVYSMYIFFFCIILISTLTINPNFSHPHIHEIHNNQGCIQLNYFRWEKKFCLSNVQNKKFMINHLHWAVRRHGDENTLFLNKNWYEHWTWTYCVKWNVCFIIRFLFRNNQIKDDQELGFALYCKLSTLLTLTGKYK